MGVPSAQMLAETAYDVGYAVGSITAALVLAYLIMWVWGGVRHRNGGFAASGFRWANHYRTLSAAGLLWLLSTVSRLGSN